MSYCFKIGESAQSGFRRIADEQASKALTCLRADRGDEITIHESRKALKRLKALFKLVRAGLAKSAYGREYTTIRDVGRSLSSTRDFEVMPATLAALVTTESAIDPKTASAVDRAIADAHAKLIQNYDRSELLDKAIQELETARRRYAILKVRDNTFATLAKGAGNGLAKLRKQHAGAVESDTDDAYHEWRKSAQLHWRHLKLLSNAWPEVIAGRIKVAKSLAEVLGHDHDLTVLTNFVESLSSSKLKTTPRKTLLAGARHRQLELRKEARAYAGLLIVDTPRQFAALLKAYNAARIEITRLREPLCNIDASTT